MRQVSLILQTPPDKAVDSMMGNTIKGSHIPTPLFELFLKLIIESLRKHDNLSLLFDA